MRKLTIASIILIAAGVPALLMLNLLTPQPAKIANVKSGEILYTSINKFTEFHPEDMDPLQFLHSLESRTGAAAIGFPAGWAPDGWIKPEHVDELIKLVDSKTPCAAVVSLLSSYLPTEGSTVGNEAMFLIDGYKSGRYPPALYSTGYNSKKRDPAEYKKWWKETGEKKQELYAARQNCGIVYLAPEKNPRLSAGEANRGAGIFTVHSQKELEEFTDGLLRRYVIWVDRDAAGLVDKDWLYERAVKDRIPVAFIGCSNTLYSFRDVLNICRYMNGLKIPENEKDSDGFCIYRFYEETKTESSITVNALSRGFPGKPALKDILNISKKVNENDGSLKFGDSLPPEQKAQYYYWALKSNPDDSFSRDQLISILPQISWSELLKADTDDPFDIMAWFREQSLKADGDGALLSFMKSRTGLDGAPAEGYFSYLADILDSNPQRFVRLLASLEQEDADDLCRDLSYEIAYKEGLSEKLKNMARDNPGVKEKDLVLKLLGNG